MHAARWDIQQVIEQALAEDIGWGDLTTSALIPDAVPLRADAISRDVAVIAGLSVFKAVFHAVDSDLSIEECVDDGESVGPGQIIATVMGDARAVLQGERVALNFLQRMSGIATETARYVAAVGDRTARILDTRKTTPGLRALEKYAVRMGGGTNHRFALCDAILIKDNHLAVLEKKGMGIAEAVRRARDFSGPMVRVEVEVESAEDAGIAAEAGADIILLDNMSLPQIQRAVDLVSGRAQLEVSGGVTLEKVPALANCGVDFISVGALTHTIRAVDISLEVRVDNTLPHADH